MNAQTTKSIYVAFIVFMALLGACGGGGSDSYSGGGNACQAAAFDIRSYSSQVDISFAHSCNLVTYNTTNATRDQFGRVTAFDYEHMCSNGSERSTGRIANIQFNSLGQVLSLTYTVNGTTCGKYACTYDANNQPASCARQG